MSAFKLYRIVFGERFVKIYIDDVIPKIYEIKLYANLNKVHFIKYLL